MDSLEAPLVRKKSWSQRTFGKMEEGSMRATLFTLTTTSMETGCLSLPLALKYVGIIPGVVLIVLAALASLIGMNSISRAAERQKVFEYSGLVAVLLGKIPSVALEIIIITYILFQLVGYHILCVPCITDFSNQIGVNLDGFEYYIMGFYTLVIVFPLSLQKKVSEMKFLAILSMGSIIYIAVVIVIQFPYYLKENLLNELEWFKLDTNFFSACSFALFAFVCHMSVATVFSEMKNPVIRRMKKVNFRACMIQLLTYIVLAVFGYLSVVDETPLFITQRRPPPLHKSDWLMNIGRLLLVVVILNVMVLFIILCRINIISFANKLTPVQDKNNLVHLGTTLFIIGFSVCVPILIPEALIVVNFLGATSAVFGFLYPALLEVANSRQKWTAPKNLFNLILSSSVTLVGVISVINAALL